MNKSFWLQTTQPTSGGAVTADSSCCANCVEPSRPQQWGPDLPFWGMRTRFTVLGHADPIYRFGACGPDLPFWGMRTRFTVLGHADPIYRFGACGPDLPFWGMRTRWLLLTKAGDVETNPGPTTLNKQV